jgi:hypothetical protein
VTSIGGDAFMDNKLERVIFLGNKPEMIDAYIFNSNRPRLSIITCKTQWRDNDFKEFYNGGWILPEIANGDVDCDGHNIDTDNDGVVDSLDAFPLDASETIDSDSDGIGNNLDTDDDNDGMSDQLDVFPLDPSETIDSDSDGIGNNRDTDDDNDGVADSLDAFPIDPNETLDSDIDGIGNNDDMDDDGDGVADVEDALPLNASETIDTDADGVGNNADNDDDNDGVVDSLDHVSLIPHDQDQQLHDIDGSGSVDALTDGLIIMRYMFGFTGDDLIDGAVSDDATRTSSDEIEAYLEALIPEL